VCQGEQTIVDVVTMERDMTNGSHAVTAEKVQAAERHDDTWVKSYRYLRTAMVGLLVGLGVAVGYQTWRQGFDLLGSVSAYYYTPAQAIFVGALIGIAACMIALKGTTAVEDVFLNLGGMFAAVVAIVPTSRGADYESAIRECQQAAGPLLTEKASTALDCPSVQALAEATRANVENNMVALLVLGGLGILATALFALRERKWSSQKFWWGFGASVALYAAGAAAFITSIEWFIDNAHYIAAVGLVLCVFVVAVANVRRRQGEQAGGDAGLGQTVGVLLSPRRHDWYAWIARAMVLAAVGGGLLWYFKVITLFWLEISVAALFALFWMVQTIEQLDDEPSRAAP
jgi:hypothetical protein